MALRSQFRKIKKMPRKYSKRRKNICERWNVKFKRFQMDTSILRHGSHYKKYEKLVLPIDMAKEQLNTNGRSVEGKQKNRI